MKNPGLIIGKRNDKRVRSLLLSDDFLAWTADHHVLAEILNAVVLPEVAVFDLKLDNVRVSFHFL